MPSLARVALALIAVLLCLGGVRGLHGAPWSAFAYGVRRRTASPTSRSACGRRTTQGPAGFVRRSRQDPAGTVSVLVGASCRHGLLPGPRSQHLRRRCARTTSACSPTSSGRIARIRDWTGHELRPRGGRARGAGVVGGAPDSEGENTPENVGRLIAAENAQIFSVPPGRVLHGLHAARPRGPAARRRRRTRGLGHRLAPAPRIVSRASHGGQIIGSGLWALGSWPEA